MNRIALLFILLCAATRAFADEPLTVPFSPEVAKAAQETWAKKLKLPDTEVTNSIGMTFCIIPPGRFIMGDISEGVQMPKLFLDRISRYPVRFTKPRLMGTTEVTQAQWESVMKSTPWMKGDRPRFKANAGAKHAASYINQRMAQEFVQRLNEREKTRKYRLPTESEWEFAYRAGTSTSWLFGNDAALAKDHCWCSDSLFPDMDQLSKEFPHDVATKKPNPFGIYDMCGNVSEWTSDRSERIGPEEKVEPLPRKGDDRQLHVVRGGSFMMPPLGDLSANYGEFEPTISDEAVLCNFGFRVVCDIEEPK